MRASEFCTPTKFSFNPAVHLCRTDVVFLPQGEGMVVLIKASKTDQTRKGTRLKIGATHSSICPVRAMEKYLKYCKPTGTPLPLFTFSNGTFLTRSTFQDYLCSLLAKAGLDPTMFNTHSLRIGAATTAAAVGLPDWLIQVLGRWSSNAYKIYIRQPQQPLLQAAGILAKNHSQPQQPLLQAAGIMANKHQ